MENIRIIVFLEPIFYEDSDIFGGVEFSDGKWTSDNNPSRIINGPLSGPGEELGNPIKEEYEHFILDCIDVIKITGFIIIDSEQSISSHKPEYILMFGMRDKPYGNLIFDLRISDHSLDKYTFPDGFKQKALKYLTMNKVLDGSAAEAGIDFRVENVLVGNVRNDSWDRALNRLYLRLRNLKHSVRRYQRERG